MVFLVTGTVLLLEREERWALIFSRAAGLSQGRAISQWSLAFLAAHETLLLDPEMADAPTTMAWRFFSFGESQRPV